MNGRFIVILAAATALAACQTTKSAPTAEAPAPATVEQTMPSAGQVVDAAASQVAALPPSATFAEWVKAFRADALVAGVTGPTFDRAFANLKPNPEVLEKDNSQPEYTRPIWGYIEGAVSPQRIAQGKDLRRDNAAALADAARTHGVDPRYIIAIWGLESGFGANTGSYNVIEALATLAYGSRRPEIFRDQLLDALRILDEGDIPAVQMRGSWAGAMGQTQFMPTAFRSFAVDGDRDGRRDIWQSLPDVFHSTANYLAAHDWRPGETWGAEVRLPAGFPWDLAEVSIRKPVAAWAALGVRPIGGGKLPVAAGEASIIAPAGARGPAFIVFQNFRTILKYNNSISYGLAVAHLADRIGGEQPFVAKWPTDEPQLSRSDKRALQMLLAARGYYTGEVDGVVGPRTRAALRQFQRQIGVAPDGYPTVELLNSLRAVATS